MKTHKDIKEIAINNPVVTMGTFDGLHIGHIHVLEQLKQKAADVGGESVILTFWPHPKKVLENKDVPLLNALEEKIALFENSGIDHLVILDFTVELSKIDYNDFVRDILVGKVGVKHLVFGYDNRFGRNGEGTFARLIPLAKQFRFKLHQLQEIRIGHAVSSTRIRHALVNGKVTEANKMLGYNYQLKGVVVHGEQLGRKLGFPTANVEVACSYKLIPQSGVYACKVFYDDVCWPTMMNIGVKPTVKHTSKLFIEAHLIGFDGDIYGKTIAIQLVKKLRDEEKFDSLRDLKAQLEIDKNDTVAHLDRSICL